MAITHKIMEFLNYWGHVPGLLPKVYYHVATYSV